ncbi:DUF3888 domain-containing protein [Psychrobacillus sp. NPDC058041]|uniref:DUF3888 domain-containing protein n=1 Tax=Psychrobacillus sp. NPDC058041 TaxID=3346310 RepID=UPI0036D92FEA
MKKITYILIAITFLINPSRINAHSEQPDYKLIYDTLITSLEPFIQKEIINYYGYPKQYGLYDAKILSIIRGHEGQFSFIAKIQVTTFDHAHDPPYGKETMTFKIDPFGVKAISFQHEGDELEKDINEFYKATLIDPVTFIKGNTGYLLFKKSDGTNVNYHVQKKDGNWIVIGKNSKQGQKMDYKLPWYVWKKI